MRLPTTLSVSLALLLACSSTGFAQTINQKIVTFLEGKRGTRLGGGECAHAACEALRVSGGEFLSSEIGPDSPSGGDYVWGTLVKVVLYSNNKWSDSNPAAKALPGDIMQYGNTKFVYTNLITSSTSHTSTVAAVSTAGLPTFVYEQNSNGIRTVQKNSIDLTKLRSGWVRIYRPKARKDTLGKYKFTLVNNMTTAQTVTIKYGTYSLGTTSLTAANTASSYLIQCVSASSTTTKFSIVLSNGKSVVIDNAAGYEVYPGTSGVLSIRKLVQ